MGRDLRRVRIVRRARGLVRRVASRAQELVPGRGSVKLPEWNGSIATLPPIIVGGTGLSGTTVTARMLGHDPDYHAYPFEVRFITAGGGLTDLLAGRTTKATFERRLLDGWYERPSGRGLHQIADAGTLRAAFRELDAGLRNDPILAARRFTLRLLEPPAIEAGKRGWIDSTPNTIRAARGLLQILPDARLIHLVRDGRDVACSLTTRTWGTNDIEEALRWWARHLNASFEEVAAVGADRVLTLRMEDLLSFDREASLRRLIDFLALRDDPGVRSYFEEKVMPDRAHIGRWRTDIPPESQAAFLAAYRELSAGLTERWGYDATLIDRAEVTASP